MTVGILGLGLIGGSMARAYAMAGHTVYACEKKEGTLAFAQLAGAVHGILTADNVGACNIILLSVCPDDSTIWLKENAPFISKHALVIDLCGTKRDVCRKCFPLAEKYGFTFVGGHPMAGSHLSGFKYSRADLFEGAPMVLVPPRCDDIELLERCKIMLAPCGFGSFSVTTAEKHDRIIAFTSQLPHVLSNAFIKSPTAAKHKGFSAGSYKDLTRVAWLNPSMWAELFLGNSDNLLFELNTCIKNLSAYRDAIANKDLHALTSLLEEGRREKEKADG